ncbi:uncharacterized protein LOC101237240 [Hydra vulgaris]|uniref:Uncharacterized protein LOC101237240 n=1 Tax=Hydra vulgaris TaxID=6087 RepID=A0ABM4C205_HYDVU
MEIENFNNEYSPSDFVRYIPGGIKTKLIISVPHGGEMRPEFITDRDKSTFCKRNGGLYNAVCEPDQFTKELVFLLHEELIKHSSLEEAPHIVIAEVHRSKVDLNREVNEATMHDPEAQSIYSCYHQLLSNAKKIVKHGLFIDIHGQSHPEQWVELGYLLSKSCINSQNINDDDSSIRNLAKHSSFSVFDLICGEGSLGKFLNDEGIKSVPSPANPIINGNYFNGGYNTLFYGSKSSGEIDAIQIESPINLRSAENRTMYAGALARALVKYINLHYKECTSC